MKINILDIDKFITENNLKEVTNPINFNSDNTPTEDGVFSISIFGQLGSNERSNNWAYINLKKHFIHPVLFKALKETSKAFEKCALGQGTFVINEAGELIEHIDGESGITFLYNNFERIVFKDTGSTKRKERIELFSKLKKDQIFITKFLIMPASLRDYKAPKNEGGRIDAVDVINELYTRLIRMASTIDEDNMFAFSGVMTEANMQQTLNEIYTMLTSALAKKGGMIHQGLLGKSIDYATRSVISAPRFSTQHWNENPIKFGYTGVPLSQICVLFYPFFVKYIQDMIEPFREELEQKNVNVDEQFSEDHIKKIVNLFFKAPDMRFKEFKIETVDGKEIAPNFYREDLGRPFSITDLIYIAAYDIVQDKHVYVTRYPIEQFQNIYPSKITILSTQKTTVQKIHDRIFPAYPVIYPDYPGGHDDEEVWIDTVRPYNGYLESLGGDYDGDTVSLRAVFTQEANMEAEEFIQKKKHILNQTGGNARTLGPEAIQALYGLTREV